MDKLSTQDILDAGLDDWRKLAQAAAERIIRYPAAGTSGCRADGPVE